MKLKFARALATCAFGTVVAAPSFAANDLTGTTVGVTWLYPDSSTTYATQDVVVGPGAEITCAGGSAGTGLCPGFVDAAHIDIGAQDLSLTIDSGTTAWSGSAFNGYEFSNLSAGGTWTGYTLSTSFAGLDTSRITFTPDAVWVNMEGITPDAGQAFDITLLAGSAPIPEPTSPALLLAGLGALAVIARRRRAQQ